MNPDHTLVGRRAVARRGPWTVLRWFTLLPPVNATPRQAMPVVLLGPDAPFWAIAR